MTTIAEHLPMSTDQMNRSWYASVKFKRAAYGFQFGTVFADTAREAEELLRQKLSGVLPNGLEQEFDHFIALPGAIFFQAREHHPDTGP